MKRAFTIISTLVLLAASCGRDPTPVLPASPQPLSVAYTPSLKPVQEALYQCISEQPDSVLIVEEAPSTAFGSLNADLFIQLGTPAESEGFPVPLFNDQVAVILHPGNPAESLTQEDLRDIFSGKAISWERFNGQEERIQVWSYPDGDEVRRHFDHAVLETSPLSLQARLAPDPAVMLAGIREDPRAIGYLPIRWLTSEVRPLLVDQALQTELTVPVIALAQSEPKGALLDLLVCLQSGAGREMLGQHQPPTSPLFEDTP